MLAARNSRLLIVKGLRQDVQTPSHKTPRRFSVGDRVRVVGEAPEYQGRIVTITNRYELAVADSQRDSYRYVVFFIEDGADAVFYGFELEMAS